MGFQKWSWHLESWIHLTGLAPSWSPSTYCISCSGPFQTWRLERRVQSANCVCRIFCSYLPFMTNTNNANIRSENACVSCLNAASHLLLPCAFLHQNCECNIWTHHLTSVCVCACVLVACMCTRLSPKMVDHLLGVAHINIYSLLNIYTYIRI